MNPKQVLKKSALFRELNPLELLKITEICRRRFLPKGGVIISEGEEFETDTSLYIIVSGLVKVAIPMGSGKELVLAFLGPSDHFGEMSFLDHRPRSASVAAMEDTELLYMNHEALENLLAEEKEMSLKFFRSISKVLVKKIRDANEKMMNSTPINRR